ARHVRHYRMARLRIGRSVAACGRWRCNDRCRTDIGREFEDLPARVRRIPSADKSPSHSNTMNPKGTWKLWAGTGVVLLGVGMLAMQGTPGQMAQANVMWELEPSDRDLHSIRTDTLRVLVLRDPLTWEERTKAVSGLEWELLKRYAQQEKIPIKAVPVAHADSLLLALQLGQGDIVAAQLTPRRDRKEWIAFSSPYRMVVPVLATLRADHITYRGR